MPQLYLQNTTDGPSPVVTYGFFDGNGTSNPTSFDAIEYASVSRLAQGRYELTLVHQYVAQLHAAASVFTSTPGVRARVVEWSAAQKLIVVETERVIAPAGVPTTTTVAVTGGQVTWGEPGYVLAVSASVETAPVPRWITGLAVSSNSATMPRAGHVIAVDVTAGVDTGPTAIRSTTPGLGSVQVAYNAAGVATLTFSVLTGASQCAVQFDQAGMLSPNKALSLSGTPRAGQVMVTYDGAGVPTLTFAADDAVAEAQIVVQPLGDAVELYDVTASDRVHIVLLQRA